MCLMNKAPHPKRSFVHVSEGKFQTAVDENLEQNAVVT